MVIARARKSRAAAPRRLCGGSAAVSGRFWGLARPPVWRFPTPAFNLPAAAFKSPPALQL